ncbi:MAG TPA: DNA-binding response regulator [Deltaproteobacteria bacterium]|nr:DNA-binding response regulator [Deltaproteobacteria bacterium]
MKKNVMSHTLLIVEDDDVIRKTLSEVFVRNGFKVFSSERGNEALAIIKKHKIDIVLLDLKLPDGNGLEILKKVRALDEDVTVIVMTAYPEIKTAVSAMKCGAYDYINKPFELEELKLLIGKAVETRNLRSEVERFRYEKRNECSFEIVSSSPEFKQVQKLISTVAGTPRTSVLIYGETGTGKELVANAIHCGSERRDKPFIKLNCSAIPDNLLESEMFGHEKGAFTDAKYSQKGLFEIADGGTIFLDEIGDMDIKLQPKFLQVLESYTFRKVGGGRDITVDVRVIAATNRNLEDMVKEKRFREDLYYRLKVVVINLPPLRKRKEDIIPLAGHFIAMNNKTMGKDIQGLSESAKSSLINYQWPGNVRELKNIIERACILTNSDLISLEHLPTELNNFIENRASEPTSLSIEETERKHISNILSMFNYNISKTSEVLGISRLTLRQKIRKYHISFLSSK